MFESNSDSISLQILCCWFIQYMSSHTKFQEIDFQCCNAVESDVVSAEHRSKKWKHDYQVIKQN